MYMYSDLGFQVITLGIALILAKCTSYRYMQTGYEDPRMETLSRKRKFSCKEEMERYLYHLDENDKTLDDY